MKTLSVDVTDAGNPPTALTVTFNSSVLSESGTVSMTARGFTFTGSFSVPISINEDNGGTITVTVHASDPAGNAAAPATFAVGLVQYNS